MKVTKQYPIVCPSCQGAKMVLNPSFNPYTGDLYISCPACNGTGIVNVIEEYYENNDELPQITDIQK